MRKNVIKALSVAMAAAMVVTVAVPAVPTEAASKSTIYVVTKKTDADGGVTTYKYDKKGRVTKEVYTLTTKTASNTTRQGAGYSVQNGDGTYTWVSATETTYAPGTDTYNSTSTFVLDGVAGEPTTSSSVDASTTGTTSTTVNSVTNFDSTTGNSTTTSSISASGSSVETETVKDLVTDVDSSTTTTKIVTTYKYKNKGKAKNQVAKKTTETTVTYTTSGSETHSAFTHLNETSGYTKKDVDTSVTTYTYNKKGLCTKEVTESVDNPAVYSGWVGVDATYVASNPDSEMANGLSYASDVNKMTVTTTNKYNKKKQCVKKNVAIETEKTDVEYDQNEAKTAYYKSDETVTKGSADGYVVTLKYTKAGLPSKITTKDNTGTTSGSSVATTYNELGKVTRTVNGKANVSTESAGTSTVKYSYDKSGNVKSVKNSGKSTSFGYTVTTTATSYTSTGTSTYVYDAVNDTSTMTSDMVTTVNAEVTKSGQYVASETTSSNTVKYVYSTKANTNRITSRTAITSKIKVDGISKSYVGLDYTTFKVKKISVPTDRLFDVETAMWRLTNGI